MVISTKKLFHWQIIIKMAAANGVRRIWVGQNGLLSTPAVSAVIRERVGADVSIDLYFLGKILNNGTLNLFILNFLRAPRQMGHLYLQQATTQGGQMRCAPALLLFSSPLFVIMGVLVYVLLQYIIESVSLCSDYASTSMFSNNIFYFFIFWHQSL